MVILSLADVDQIVHLKHKPSKCLPISQSMTLYWKAFHIKQSKRLSLSRLWSLRPTPGARPGGGVLRWTSGDREMKMNEWKMNDEVDSYRCILSSIMLKNSASSGMSLCPFTHIVHFPLNNQPVIVRAVVFLHFLPGVLCTWADLSWPQMLAPVSSTAHNSVCTWRCAAGSDPNRWFTSTTATSRTFVLALCFVLFPFQWKLVLSGKMVQKHVS